jgi:arylsulfatase A-like enzyme
MNHKKPNIILINCDDLGYGDLSCYGSKKNDTPQIDRLAENGIRFTDFYMASPVCSPSRGAMMTGCYPSRISFDVFENGSWVLFPGMGQGLHPNEITVASLLKQGGYKTKLVGKWHCGDQKEHLPTAHGFDDYFGIPFSNDMGRQKMNNGEPSPYPPLPLMKGDEVQQQQPDQRGLTERYADECVRFIKDNKDEPFFLYLAHMYVHVPLFVPDQFLKVSRNGAYGGAVAEIDWTTGVLMNTLKNLGLDENTLVIFTSDNGSRARDEGGSNAPCRGVKGSTWDGGLRVPCIMHWPEGIKSGRVEKGLATSMDFYPTLAKLAGVELPTDRIIDGLDLSGLITAGAPTPREVFAYYLRRDLEAVRVGDWKLHLHRAGCELKELYNLRDDVGESVNLYTEHPEIVEKLNAVATEIRRDMGDAHLGIEGENVRPIGEVSDPVPLTQYDENHPYMIAMYDLADSKVMAG